LIPKVEGADQFNDFRPISLVHSFAKLVTKQIRLAVMVWSGRTFSTGANVNF
jgi:hypothetical protein